MSQQLLESFRLLRRVERVFERYVREGKRPSRAEAADWLRSLGWNEAPLAKLLEQWGYETE